MDQPVEQPKIEGPVRFSQGEKIAFFIRTARQMGAVARDVLLATREDNWGQAADFKTDINSGNLNMQLHGRTDILDLLDGNEELKDRKIWLIFTSGAQQASITAGVLRGMRETGMLPDEKIAGVIGVSAGATSIMGLWGNNLDASEIYAQEHTEPGGFKKLPKTPREGIQLLIKILQTGGPETAILDTTIAKRVMKSGKRPIDIQAIRDAKPELLMLTMDAETGDPYYADLKRLPDDPIDIMDAAITVPGVTVQPWVVTMDGRKLCDGAFTEHNIPVEEAFKRGATDVIVFGNKPFGGLGSSMGLSASEVSVYAQALLSTNRYGYPMRVVDLIRRGGQINRAANRELARYIREDDPYKRVLVIAPDAEVLSKLDQRRDVIERIMVKARDFGASLKNRVTSKTKELVGVYG